MDVPRDAVTNPPSDEAAGTKMQGPNTRPSQATESSLPSATSGPSYVAPAPTVRWRRLLAALTTPLFPFPCCGCSSPLPLPAPALGLCPRCRERLAPPQAPACRSCARPVPGWREDPPQVCGACRAAPPCLDLLVYAFCYQEPLTEVVRALKFRGADFLGRDLAVKLAERHREELAECHLVTPVPLSWRRLLRRGYNQAEAIARPLAQRLGRPCLRLLRRRHRQRQTGLSRRHRLSNPRLSFQCRQELKGLRVLLVDDVLTTGATLAAAAAALKAAGAASVVGAVAARTPEWGDGGH